MRRIRITVSYDGTEYHGWQLQPGLATIQGVLEQILGGIEGRPVAVHGSGRTDAGVHALAQAAAFDLTNPIPVTNLRKAVNRLLPPDIRITSAEETGPDFHPRFNARAKTYEYRIFRGEVCPPFERRYVYHHPYPLDEDAVAEAAGLFVGAHDFAAFAAADQTDVPGTPRVRTVFSSAAWRDCDRLLFRIRGSGFLKHMVRNMTGLLLEVGKGNLSPDDVRERLATPAAFRPGPAAPARGLFLISVEYPS
ncbi:MAG: tRNA pseudouridine(38-40) synthase TruA [Bryobacterales bacterium]|nr:tRNA pseudouridine(38-40) synthase TruA [Bryobacterales bacterium]